MYHLKLLIFCLLSAIITPESLYAQEIAGCPIFPKDNIWNTRIDRLPVDPKSTDYIKSIGQDIGLHPDFGSGLWMGAPNGIPYMIVSNSLPLVAVQFEYANESDPGPYPIPPDPAIEGGPGSTGDRHIILLNKDTCTLYEIFSAYPNQDGSWRAGSGAIFDLKSNKLRSKSWTSADAAGLPILSGLARYEEVASGEIQHALRFTCERTRQDFVWPARHFASRSTNASLPPMGQRFRLKSSYDISPYSTQTKIILTALKKYGMILADNGGNWFISGSPHPNWNNDRLVNELRMVKGSDFEAVDTSSLMVNPNSAEALQSFNSSNVPDSNNY